MASEEIGSVPGSHLPLKQWLQSAAQKFSRGFVLLINKEKKTARFFKAGKGYHACPYRMALLLVQHGMVTEVRPHPIHGAAFGLAEGVTPAILRALNPDDAVENDDDEDDVQDDTEGEGLDVDLDDDEISDEEEEEEPA
ncbi:MAG: hypothetical protein RhofKO_33710 [Rhodothermales bacterium]